MAQQSISFFNEQKDWSKRKLAIISSYLAGFAKILGSTTSQPCVYYIDGFAGTGIYTDGSKGSPVLAAELAQEYLEQRKKYQLKCINIEADEKNFQNLEEATTQYKNVVNNLLGTFSSNIPRIMNDMGRCPAFFFIDPFGVKDTDWIDMMTIVHRPYPTDLWLRFDHKTVRRLSGFFDSGSRGADGKNQRLLRFYGLQRTDNLFPKIDGNSCEERIDNAVNYYVERLEFEFQQSHKQGYSAAFPIVSLEGENKYYLVFAASHPKAAILASETIYSVERNRPKEMLEYQQRKTGQMSLLLPEPSEDELSKSIAEGLTQDIWRLCSGKKLTRQNIYMMILNCDKKKWFGHFSSAQLNLAFQIMESGVNPKIVHRKGAKSQNKTIFLFR